MDLIATTTVGSGGAASVTFSSIPATYTDLIIVASARHTSATGDNLIAQLNGTTTGYTSRYLGGTGLGVENYTASSLGITSGLLMGNIGGTSYTANTFQASQITIPNYAGTTAKICIANGGFENNGTTGNHSITTSQSTVTAAITSILIKSAFYNLAEHSTFSLYGVLKGSGGATV
jgi:hypothetical protein